MMNPNAAELFGNIVIELRKIFIFMLDISKFELFYLITEHL